MNVGDGGAPVSESSHSDESWLVCDSVDGAWVMHGRFLHVTQSSLVAHTPMLPVNRVVVVRINGM